MLRQNLTSSKNALWVLYREAEPLVRDEIILELKKAKLIRHWHYTASREQHDLPNAKAQLRDIFLELLPCSAPLFGLEEAPLENPKRKKKIARLPQRRELSA